MSAHDRSRTTPQVEGEAAHGERDLQESEERFRLLVESVKDYAIFMLDPSGRVVSWNPGAERIKGYRAGEIIGRHFSTFYPQAGIDAGKCEFELEVASREGRFEEEGWRIRKDGGRFWANVVISAIRSPEGRLLGFAKVTRDLTVRLQAEAERMQRVAAEEREQRKDEFLAIMGHELRNPLAPMMTAVHLIKLRRGINCSKEIAVMERQITHMMRLIDDLLDVSRTVRGAIQLVRKPVEVTDLLADAITTATPLIEERRHTLDVEALPGLFVCVDHERMTQVFSNLLNNAAKYTDEGGQIRIRAVRTDETIDVIIEDNGRGMSAELLPQVFGLFIQGKQALDRQLGGLGVGLAVAKRLVDEHGGRLIAESDGLGRGSRFTVKLEPSLAPATEPAQADRAPTPTSPTSTGRRVLVVDDNRDAGEMLCTVLEAMGHTTVIAYDGPQALQIAPEFAPELAFIDIGLPGMNGLELVAKLRTTPACREIPLVALTGYARETDRREALAAGFSDHVGKPIEMAMLRDLVDRLDHEQS